MLETGHAFSFYLSCHEGAFLMDVVCGRIGLLYVLVAQRYQSLSLGFACEWSFCKRVCNSQPDHMGAVLHFDYSDHSKWLHTWGK